MRNCARRWYTAPALPTALCSAFGTEASFVATAVGGDSTHSSVVLEADTPVPPSVWWFWYMLFMLTSYSTVLHTSHVPVVPCMSAQHMAQVVRVMGGISDCVTTCG
jgi:hypothetical protein